MTAPSLPTLTPSRVGLRPVSRRATSADAVVLRPLVPTIDSVPSGYLARFRRHSGDVNEQVSLLAWTLQALRVLSPDSFLAAELSIPAVCNPSFERLVDDAGASRLLPILTAARVGRRLAELARARVALQALGMRVGVTGPRIRSGEGFDAFIVARPFAVAFDPAGAMLIATDLTTTDDLVWAEGIGADLVEGSAVAEPIRVAPVDLKRLRR